MEVKAVPRQAIPVVEDLQVGALSWAAVQALPKSAGLQGSTLHSGSLWAWSRSGLQRWDLTSGRHDPAGPIYMRKITVERSFRKILKDLCKRHRPYVRTAYCSCLIQSL